MADGQFCRECAEENGLQACDEYPLTSLQECLQYWHGKAQVHALSFAPEILRIQVNRFARGYGVPGKRHVPFYAEDVIYVPSFHAREDVSIISNCICAQCVCDPPGRAAGYWTLPCCPIGSRWSPGGCTFKACAHARGDRGLAGAETVCTLHFSILLIAVMAYVTMAEATSGMIVFMTGLERNHLTHAMVGNGKGAKGQSKG